MQFSNTAAQTHAGHDNEAVNRCKLRAHTLTLSLQVFCWNPGIHDESPADNADEAKACMAPRMSGKKCSLQCACMMQQEAHHQSQCQSQRQGSPAWQALSAVAWTRCLALPWTGSPATSERNDGRNGCFKADQNRHLAACWSCWSVQRSSFQRYQP